MKYRGNEIKRTKAFVVDGMDDVVPIYVYPVSNCHSRAVVVHSFALRSSQGFVYESVLHYATFKEYGGILVQVKNLLQKQLEQTINHIIVTKYDQPADCIGWHNDKVKTIEDNSIIAVISLGAKRRFQLRTTPTEGNKDPAVLKEIRPDNGSLINMSYNANLQYQHCVAPYDASKGDEKGTRVSIVFRNIKYMMRDQIENKGISQEKRR
jgi:alkylated DNA repair dioxygenase AlkB